MSKEIRDILAAYQDAKKKGQNAVLATVVEVEGSSYRRPGARMLVTEDGTITGAISGGCLEGDARRKALLALRQNTNKLISYDSTDESDAEMGVQLGCNGIVHILFEPLFAENGQNVLEQIAANYNPGSETFLVTHFAREGAGGTQCMQHVQALPQDLQTTLGNMPAGQHVAIVDDKHAGKRLVQRVPPVLQLIIAGAGNDAIPLHKLATELGWRVAIGDGRPAYATQKRFEGAQVYALKPQPFFDALAIDAQTFCMLMTHNYPYDLAMLQLLLATETPYIGVLGPAAKGARMVDDLRNAGVPLDEQALAKMHAPAGLDLGAETPDEIAVSIVAEILAVQRGHTGGFLKHRNKPIHERE